MKEEIEKTYMLTDSNLNCSVVDITSETLAPAGEEMDSDVINLSKNLKQSLLDNSIKSNTEISKYWDTIDFNSLLN